jgi:LmbE family N-acetylglucosaminyl deacetylase/chromosome segregation ATPase
MSELLSPENVLIIVAHHDDEALLCGGYIQHLHQRGVKINILVVTDIKHENTDYNHTAKYNNFIKLVTAYDINYSELQLQNLTNKNIVKLREQLAQNRKDLHKFKETHKDVFITLDQLPELKHRRDETKALQNKHREELIDAKEQYMLARARCLKPKKVIGKIKKEVDILKQSREAIKESIYKIKDEQAHLKKELTSLGIDQDQLKNETEDLNKTQKALLDNIDKYQDTLVDIRADITTTKTSLARTRNKIHALKADQSTLDGVTLNKNKRGVVVLEIEYNNITENIINLEGQYNTINTNKIDALAQCNSIEHNKIQIKEQYATINSAKTSFREKYYEADRDRIRYDREADCIHKDIITLLEGDTYITASDNIEAINRQSLPYRDTYNTAIETYDNTCNEYNKSRDYITQFYKQYTKLKPTIITLNNKYRDISQKIQGITTSIRRNPHEVESYSKYSDLYTSLETSITNINELIWYNNGPSGMTALQNRGEYDLILTHGAPGEYGHPQHILVNRVVTDMYNNDAFADIPIYTFSNKKVSTKVRIDEVKKKEMLKIYTFKDSDSTAAVWYGQCIKNYPFWSDNKYEYFVKLEKKKQTRPTAAPAVMPVQ